MRTARRGKNAGGQFWGCSQYPLCEGTLNSDEVQPDRARGNEPILSAPPSRIRTRRKVEWRDGTMNRSGWVARYTQGGASLRSVDFSPALLRRVSACWIAREELDAYRPADAATRRVIAPVRKILQRGLTPPLHPQTERELVSGAGLGDRIRPPAMPGDLSPRMESPLSIGSGQEGLSWMGQHSVTQQPSTRIVCDDFLEDGVSISLLSIG